MSWKKGKHFSKKHKEKISSALIGIKRSDDFKKKLRNANLGKHLSIKTREKISKAQIGKIMSIKTREKISNTLKGRLPANLKENNEKHHGENHQNLKGENGSYSTFHKWIRKYKKIGSKCELQISENCNNLTGKKTKLEFANINKEHKDTRDPNKYITSCRSCHHLFDNNKMNV